MLLSLTAIDKDGELRHFSCWFDKLEVIFDTLSEISTKGGQLLTADVIDENGRLSLPVEAFDGDVLSNPIQALEAQWQQVLSEPVNSQSVYNQWLLTMTRDRIKTQDTYMVQLEEAIRKVEMQRQRILATPLSEARRLGLLNRNEQHLTLYQRHLAIALARQDVHSSRLAQWQDR